MLFNCVHPKRFVLFQVIVFMIMLNVFIGIISESFCEEHSKKMDSLNTEVKSLLNSLYKGVKHRTWGVPADPNAGRRKLFFDPPANDLVRTRTVKERKECPGGDSYGGRWGAYRGLPSDSAQVWSETHKPERIPEPVVVPEVKKGGKKKRKKKE